MSILTPPGLPVLTSESAGENNPILPWSGDKNEEDVFFPSLDIDGDRWNKLYPYKLIVIDVSSGSPVVVNGSSATGSVLNNSIQSIKESYSGTSGISYHIKQKPVNLEWEYTFPITPQQFSITDQFAINTTATMRGVIEEHNGVKFKIIAMSGTTGIWPNKPTEAEPPKSSIPLFGFGANTFEALTDISKQISNVSRAVTGNKRPSTAKLPSLSGQDQFTGYFQALLLSQFLERYAIAKKDPANNGWRLVLNIPKENQSFICTPQQFSLTKSQQRPNEYLWSLQLKAWKRIDLSDSKYESNQGLASPAPNYLAKANALMRESRRTISAAVNVLRAVRSDVDAVLEVIRQAALVVKDLGGFAVSVGDLNSYLVYDIGRSLENSNTILKNALNAIATNPFKEKALSSGNTASSASSAAILSASSSETPDDQTTIGMLTTANYNARVARDKALQDAINLEEANKLAVQKEKELIAASPEGKAAAKIAKDEADAAAVAAQEALDASNKAIEDIGKTQVALNQQSVGFSAIVDDQSSSIPDADIVYASLDETAINDLILELEQQRAIDADMEQRRLTSIDDLLKYKDIILTLALDVSNSFGAGHVTYANIYDRPDPKERSESMTIEENELCLAIFDIVSILDTLTATKVFDDKKIESPLSYVGNLAAQSDISFDDATSKFLVPVPFGLTIELIAARYLGNPDKWIELATLNHLRSPYIDEEGFQYSLLSNATGRQFNVDDSLQRLYIGQKIILSSNSVGQIIRKIANIEKINDNNHLITTDGLADLDSLQTTNSAIMQGYLPGTVNSQDQIFIPTNNSASADDRIKTPPSFRNDQLTRISKIDWLLTDDGDLAINGLGEFRLANGLNNLLQALKLKIRTKKGSLLRHLDFGLGLQHGISIADIEQGVLIQELTRIVVQDNRFSGVSRLEMTLTGNTLTINMEVTIANNNGVLPISFDV